MITIVEFFEKIQKTQNLFNFIDLSRSYDYLKRYNKNTMLILGAKSHPRFKTLDSFDIEKIKAELQKYNLFVLDKTVCKLPNDDISNLLELFKNNKKNVIFVGYSCYTNLNINNTNKMFRPIDVTKYPFNKKNTETIYKNVSIKLVLLYIFCVISIILGNKRDSRLLYKFVIILLIIIPIAFPFKKVIFIKNSQDIVL